ncbi:MAG: type III-A CRISPR-associated RAMP protein Csm3 [Saprospiraceae bacterium]|nr:type III-A CRISPR-associated RAMP protein Csm3 [Lewinella sp.]
MSRLNKKIFISARLKLITGMRIGDSKEKVEIGGVDSPIVRRKDNYAPYIPGSSIKGKIRSLLELMAGENFDNKFKNTGSLISQLFGAAENKDKDKNLPSRQSRLIVRDADLTPESADMLLNSEYTDLPYTEIKWENAINRLTGTAENPRQFERVPAGAEFNLYFVINVFEGESDEDFKALLHKGIEALQDDYLGGSGTRGYGQVEIEILEEKEKDRAHYLKNTSLI